MIHAVIAGLILLGIYKLMKEPDGEFISLGATFAFVMAPAFLIFLIAIGLVTLGVNPVFTLFAYLLYLIIPFFWLKHFLEFNNASAFKYAIFVPVVAIATEILFASLIGYLG